MQENETEKIIAASARLPKQVVGKRRAAKRHAVLHGWKKRGKVGLQAVRRALIFLLPGNVSRIHYYEARERYFSLKRRVEQEKGLIPQSDQNPDQERSWKTLLLCETILDVDMRLLTRRQENLNRLWRSLTRVTVMLINNVWTEKQLAGQLNVCREEAYRLQIEDDPAISNFLQQIAEIIDESGDLGDRKPRVKRTLVAAWERFNSIRTRRIHDQYIMSKTYQAAFFFLLVISFMIISNHQVITQDWNRGVDTSEEGATLVRQQAGADNAFGDSLSVVAEEVDLEPVPSTVETVILAGDKGSESTASASRPADALPASAKLIDRVNGYLSKNVLAFIYLGGLAGGFFSVVTRISRDELAPGADAYFIQYILTKPFVGAFGAIVLFILFAGGLTSFDTVPERIELASNGTVFGIAFLLGFSERLAFPSILPA